MFVSAHVFRGVSPLSLLGSAHSGPVVIKSIMSVGACGGACFPHSREEGEKEPNLQSDLLPPVRHCLLRLSTLSKTVSLAVTRHLTHEPMGSFYSQAII